MTPRRTKLGRSGHELDATDVKLLAALQQNGKAPLAALGQEVGLSAPAVMERLRKLEAAGVIKSYPAMLDARKLGIDITAFIGIRINYPKKIKTFEEWVREEPRVLECHHVTGSSTLLLKVKCANTEALEELIGQIRLVEGVESTETLVALSTPVERVALPLDPGAFEDPEPRPRRRRRAARPAADTPSLPEDSS